MAMTAEQLHSKSDIAAELGWRDMQIAALQQNRDALAAENAALKAGPQGFFAYGGDCGYEEFKTADEARKFANEEIAYYREQACDGWSDEVGGVVWGIVMQRATMTGLRAVEEGDNCAEGFTEWCDYTLLPNVETPAADAILNTVRAEGVEMLAENHQRIVDTLDGDSLFGDGERRHAAIAAAAVHFAGQLRADAAKDGV
ncbi:hypothetical protein [Pantoea wallisii]|nr:hypothetical protein [Pantoea wallisii]